MFTKILTIFAILKILIVGVPEVDKSHILDKRITKDDVKSAMKQRIQFWVHKSFYIIKLAIIVLIIALICYIIMHLVGLSTVESGTVYYHLEDII